MGYAAAVGLCSLNKQTEDLLGAEAPLSQVAQEALLDGVEGVFTDKDNEMLEKEITNEEVWESLKCSNINSAPGSDGISFVTYVQCWSSLGSHLCEVLREDRESVEGGHRENSGGRGGRRREQEGPDLLSCRQTG